MSELVNDLIKNGYLKNDLLIEAFNKIDRIEFVPEEIESIAESDIALPIGYGQTISQPRTVAFMLELLDPAPGQKILDVGSGSGWTTALLSQIVGAQGKVIAFEIIENLKVFGEKNVDKFGFIKNGIAKIICADGSHGYPEEAPFDRILVSASGKEIPEPLKNQLKVEGKLVMPVEDSLVMLEKISEKDFRKEEYPGFVFVSLITR